MIPKVKYGLIGGSGTWGTRFPEDLKRTDVKLLKIISSFNTPYGHSAPFKLLEIAGEKVLRVATHGWTKDKKGNSLPAWICALQVAWVFEQAGVKYAITDGSVGGIKNPERPHEPITPWSVLTPDDFIMHWVPPQSPINSPKKPTVRMKEPFCLTLRKYLFEAANKNKKFHPFFSGTYLCSLTNRYETKAEIRMMAGWGAHVVGQTLGHEAPLMRDRGIHFAAINIVANVAEGYVSWTGTSQNAMADFYRDCALPMGNVIIDAITQLIKHGPGKCSCSENQLTGLDKFPVKGA